MAIAVLISFVKILIVLFGVINFAAFLTWVERKQSAVMQDRIGANRASVLGFRIFGLFHPIADAIKMIAKEDYVPPKGDKFLHTLAPMISLFFALTAFAVIPFGSTINIWGMEIKLQAVELNVGVLFVFAMLSLGIYGPIFAGWASANNYSLLGGLRAAAQMISYEVTMGATIVGAIMVYQTLDLMEMVNWQGGYLLGFIPMWGIIFQPLGFILFTTAILAETKRVPFDLPEGESEIIGYFLEYSSMKFAMFMMTDLVETVVAAGLVSTLFFGGWQVPFLMADGFHWPWGAYSYLPYALVIIGQIIAFAIKVSFFCWLFMLIRWTLPRFRYDQLMHLGWKMLLPVSIANIMVTGIITLLIGK